MVGLPRHAGDGEHAAAAERADQAPVQIVNNVSAIDLSHVATNTRAISKHSAHTTPNLRDPEENGR